MSNHTSHPDETILAAYLDGVATEDERREVERHVEVCSACRAALAGVSRLLAEPPRTERRRRRLLPVAGTMAAAAAVAALLLFPQPRASRDVTRATRTEDLARVVVLQPANNSTVGRDQVDLEWQAADAPSYTVYVLDQAGTLVWQKQQSETRVRVPAQVLKAGTRYFWYVDAVADRVVATSGTLEFVTPP